MVCVRVYVCIWEIGEMVLGGGGKGLMTNWEDTPCISGCTINSCTQGICERMVGNTKQATKEGPMLCYEYAG